MAELTESDVLLLKEEASQIEYGTIKMEFKKGVCLAISHEGRILTAKGKQTLLERNASRKG